MSGVAASFDQATGILKLLCETRWKKDEMQRRFFAIWGLLRDIGLAVGDGKISEEQVRAMHPLFYGKTAKSAFPSEAIAREYGYTVVEDVEPTLSSAADLEAVSFLEPGEFVVSGETMRQRAVVKKANLGLADLKVALDDQKKISVEEYIVFSGTLLRNPDGHLCVAVLRWGDDGWYLDFGRVACGWFDSDRLARCK